MRSFSASVEIVDEVASHMGPGGYSFHQASEALVIRLQQEVGSRLHELGIVGASSVQEVLRAFDASVSPSDQT
ncbi:hypothetical protein AB0M48_39015 [Lentzea sp. NPDC051208]|uniref:hypothetical protein n=1 Tax=Lentzea sp. NPDC051208 TaxID=3154642 RepID=UPI00342EAB5E